jgi:hypothetical protein
MDCCSRTSEMQARVLWIVTPLTRTLLHAKCVPSPALCHLAIVVKCTERDKMHS